jgi:hypothetical protein
VSRGVPTGWKISFFTAKVRDIQYFDFLNRWVSLKEREFTYSKFQQIINSNPYILSMVGSSIPLSRNEQHALIVEYRMNQACRKVDFRSKTAISLHRCAMIKKAFFRYDQ